ncbi:YveK family protein [Acetobacterium woodii]|uniref:Putative lipopolysaccharide biosynthesis protein n=1 Tax=Acetobacterium woodii (strain ATCC 29683 / DSM 1030 / JCM 2381 / KCTC 1655 / WB1) TaxID=931626 RepID=H6LKR9_ACEWD|nr:Wzz/FepE/Etk N-terminal domain-containing protein [Acetobacterium woodii]AFA48861.1 putative lipopolysaccharide biosynthesis protein [Acetobacterium woodii DSM 1030]
MNKTGEVDLKELFRIVLKKWWLIILLTIVGFVGAYFGTAKLITPIYEAKTVLYIGRENSGLGTIDVSLGQLEADSQLIIDYKEIALTRLVIDAVVKNTGLNINDNESKNGITGKSSMTYTDFQKNTEIEAINNSRLFTVGFKDPDPEIAKKVSDELAKQLTIAVSQIVGVENIRILDQSTLPVKPISPNILINTIIGGLFGLLFSLFVILIMFLFNDTVKDEDDIKSLIDVSVLGSIPEFKGEAR